MVVVGAARAAGAWAGVETVARAMAGAGSGRPGWAAWGLGAWAALVAVVQVVRAAPASLEARRLATGARAMAAARVAPAAWLQAGRARRHRGWMGRLAA
jgi:hypothetical protein